MRKQRFRRLTTDELAELQPEFVKFLIVNGIDADTWQKMKHDQDDQAEEMVGIFSDMVLENMLKSAKYLTLATTNHIVAYQCNTNNFVAVGIKSSEEAIDLSSSDYLTQLAESDLSTLDIYHATKSEIANREDEMFTLVLQGCVISDGSDFKDLSIAYAKFSS